MLGMGRVEVDERNVRCGMNGVVVLELLIFPVSCEYSPIQVQFSGGELTIFLTFLPDLAKMSFMTLPNCAG